MLSTRPRVLLADDYPDMVKAVSRLLALDCEIVGTVADGGALVETAQRLQPDVIVLVNPAMKVIMFTAMDDPNAGQAFVEAGASAFVSKLASADLLSTIRRLCATEADTRAADTQQDRRT